MDLEHCGLSESISDLEVAEWEPIPGLPEVFLDVKNVVRLKPSVHNINKVPSNGVMSSQSDNVVTFVWPPFHQGIEPETNFMILSLRRGV
jgi:hypothetical protein